MSHIQAVHSAGHTGKSGGNNKGFHPEGSDIDTHGLGGDPVITDSLNGPAFLGIDDVKHHKKGEKHQDKAHKEGGNLVVHRNTDTYSTIDDIGLPLRRLVRKRKTHNAICIAHIQVLQDIPQDLAKCQGHDGQVVAPQTQGRNTHQEADHTSGQAAAQKANDQTNGGVRQNAFEKGCGDHARIYANAHKACMAQAQLTADTYQQVQRYSQADVHADTHQLAAHKTGQHAGLQLEIHNGKCHGHHKKSDAFLGKVPVFQ